MKALIPLAALIVFHLYQSPAQTVKMLPPAGGGPDVGQCTECLTPQDRARIDAMLADNIRYLTGKGYISAVPSNDYLPVKLDWPLRKTADNGFNSYYVMNNFVDQDHTSGVKDFACENRAFDKHKGTDMENWPFPWYQYQNNMVEVIAAAAGIIIGKIESNDDDHCGCYGFTNGIFILHSDGAIVWYTSLKKNSLTRKGLGQSVLRGEYLGVVASAGCSQQPHLHLEVYDNQGNLVDPFKGDCNTMNKTSWWYNQEPYRHPMVNAALTHSDVPVFGCGSTIENPKIQNEFYPEMPVYTAAYFRDQTKGLEAIYRIVQPDDVVWQTWSQTFSDNASKAWWYWTWNLPSNGPFGMWRFEVEFNGETVVHEFSLLNPLAADISDFNAVVMNEQFVRLSWKVRSETNNDYFQVEHSVNGQDFWAIGKVKGRGTSDELTTCFFDHATPLSGVNYYQLRIMDVTGSFKLSNIISVLFNLKNPVLYPNPATDEVNIAGKIAEDATLRILDMTGHALQERTLPASNRLSLGHLPRGMYVVEITTGNQKFINRLMMVDE